MHGDDARGAAARAAETVRESLFRARWELMSDQRGKALLAVREVRTAFDVTLAPTLGVGARVGEQLSLAAAAAQRGDSLALAAARGGVVAGLTVAAYRLTLHAIATDQPALASEWAAVRDLGPSAGSSTVQDNALRAVAQFAAGTLSGPEATMSVRRDTLDALQRRTLGLVQQATLDGYLGVGLERIEAGTLAAGYWQVLAPIYTQHLETTAGSVDGALATLASPGSISPAEAADRLRLQAANSTALGALGAFTAAPPTAAEQGRRIRQLIEAMRFTIARLCGGATPIPPNGEPQGTVQGPPVVARLINDLRPTLPRADAARLTQAGRALETLPGAFGISGEESSPKAYHRSASVQSACTTATGAISTVFPVAWERHDDDADFEQIERALARSRQAAARGEWSTASDAAREAYAVFDLTPELRLLAVDPALAIHVEALFWNGGSSGRSLFDVLANHTSQLSLGQRQSEIEGALDQAQIVLDVSHSRAAVAVNSGIVVFREGLEALLIVAALSAGFVTVGGRWRRPVILGAIAALPATLVTWALTDLILTSFVGYGLQLQAVLDMAALAVLAIMLAWFFQKFCWTRFTAREQARHRRMVDRAPRGSARVLGPSLGLAAVGFTVIYREGFETVLYLQALREQAGGGAVVEGVLLGALFTTAIAVLMLRLRRRLPYRGVVVATATLVGILTVVMTGQAMRALQAAGWLAITPVHVDLPVWAGQWLGIYPSAQTLLAQLVCAVAIPLVAILSERLRTRRLERRMAIARERIARKRAAGRSARDSEQPVDGATRVVGASALEYSKR
jgi:high-affinity iron transporter